MCSSDLLPPPIPRFPPPLCSVPKTTIPLCRCVLLPSARLEGRRRSPMALILVFVRDVPHSLALSQAINPTAFDVELEQWLDSLPTRSLAARGILPPPGEVLRRPSYANNDVRIQRDRYLALSGTVAVTLDAVRLSIRAPPFLFLSAHPPMLSIWLPISDWGNVPVWSVIEALQHAARSLRHPYDPGETLFGQMFAKNFVRLYSFLSDSY